MVSERHAGHPERSVPERATEWVAVLMTPSEKAVFSDCAKGLGPSLGQFFREAGAAYAGPAPADDAETATLEAALRQLECSTRRAEQVLDDALAEVRAALQATA